MHQVWVLFEAIVFCIFLCARVCIFSFLNWVYSCLLEFLPCIKQGAHAVANNEGATMGWCVLHASLEPLLLVTLETRSVLGWPHNCFHQVAASTFSASCVISGISRITCGCFDVRLLL